MAKFITAPGYFLPHPIPSDGLQNRRVAARLDSEQREALRHALNLRRTARYILESKGLQTPIGVYVPESLAGEISHQLADINTVMAAINRLARGAFHAEINDLRVDVDNSPSQNHIVKSYLASQLEKLAQKLQVTRHQDYYMTQSPVPRLHYLVGDAELAREVNELAETTKKWDLNASHAQAVLERIEMLRTDIKAMEV